MSVPARRRRGRTSAPKSAYDIGLIASRDSVEDCVSRRLDEVEGLIRAAAAGALPQRAALARPPALLSRAEQPVSGGDPVRRGQACCPPRNRPAIPRSTRLRGKLSGPVGGAGSLGRTAHAGEASGGQPGAGPAIAQRPAKGARGAVVDGSLGECGADAANELAVKPNVVFRWTQQSACIPVGTPRAEAEKLVMQGRTNGSRFDEP